MARAGRPNLWGWSRPARRTLAILPIAAALAIGWASRPTPGVHAPDPALVVDPNSAPPAVLMALPRIGPVLASRIVGERGRRPFDDLSDLDRRVKGIGPATVTALRPYLRFQTDAPAEAQTVPSRIARGRARSRTP